MIDFTTVVGVDLQHLEELELVWPTWRALRPEILRHPLLWICDGDVPGGQWQQRLALLEHPDCRIVSWTMAGVDQREKMLSGLVLATAAHVDTRVPAVTGDQPTAGESPCS